ncbi:MAG: hypothetical protein ABR600_07855 [Actinomycetota bacterium]
MTEGPALGTTPRTADPQPAGSDRRVWDIGVFVALGMVAAVVIMFYGRGERTFIADEWQIVLYRRLDGLDAFLTQYNGHLAAMPVLVYRSLFATVGDAPYSAFRAAGLVVHVAIAGAVFAYARRRVPPLAALAAAVLVLFLGRGWEVLLWPMNAFFFGIPLLMFVVALLLLDRRDLRGDSGAGLAVAVALASSGVGIPVAAGLAVELAWTQWRRLWVIAVPMALWGAWALTVKGTNPLVDVAVRIPGATPGDVVSGAGPIPPPGTLLAHLPSYVGHEAAAAFGGVIGVRPAFGVGIGVVAVVLLGRKLLADRRVSPRLTAIAATLVVFWLATAVTRSHVADPQTSRYTYVTSILLILLFVEAARGVALTRRPWRIGIAAVVAMGVLFGLQQLSFEGRVLRHATRLVAGALAKIERDRGSVDPAFRPAPGDTGGISAGPYLALVDALGSPVSGRGPSSG